MTDKTTAALKLAEEALDELRYANDTDIAKTKYYKALAAIREALAKPDIEEMTLTQIASRHEPVKQEPIGFIDESDLRELSNGNERQYSLFVSNKGRMVAVYAAPVQPINQQPVAVISESAIGLVKLHSNGACLPFGTQLYAAPVDAKAIRAEALEEAAKWFEDEEHPLQPKKVAAAIRRIK